MNLIPTSSVDSGKTAGGTTTFLFFEARGTAVFIIAGPVVATGEISFAAATVEIFPAASIHLIVAVSQSLNLCLESVHLGLKVLVAAF